MNSVNGVNGAMRRPRRLAVAATILAALVLGAACGRDSRVARPNPSASTGIARGTTVKLLTHDAWAVTPAVLDAFTQQTGIKVQVLKNGDAGAMVNQAILAKDRPVADALFGVDNTFLSRAIGAGLFQRRSYRGLDAIDPAVRAVFAPYEQQAVPIDRGDVCLNYDKGWFASRRLAPPATLDDLTRPQYRNLTVVENPATSSPGFAFLLATITRYGAAGWQDYWKRLRANGVRAVDSWSTAYQSDFTAGGGKGASRPIVVSYASSPPADIVFADPPKTASSVGVVRDGCFRQYELAGVLANAARPDAAQQLVEFLFSARFQADMPLQMFVWPVRTGTPLPAVFTANAALATDPVETPPASITDTQRRTWTEQWTAVMGG